MIKKIMLLVACLFSTINTVNADSEIHRVNFIKGENLNIRTTPEVKDNIAFVITKGWKSVVVLKTKQGPRYSWSKIKLTDKREGWIISPLVDSIDTQNVAEIKLKLLLDLGDILTKNDFNKSLPITEFYTSYLLKYGVDRVEPSLFFYEKENDFIIWKVWNARNNKTTELHRTASSIPQYNIKIDFDKPSNTAYFSIKNDIFSVQSGKSESLNKIATLSCSEKNISTLVDGCDPETSNISCDIQTESQWFIEGANKNISIYNVCYNEFWLDEFYPATNEITKVSKLNLTSMKWREIPINTYNSLLNEKHDEVSSSNILLSEAYKCTGMSDGFYGPQNIDYTCNSTKKLPTFAKKELANFIRPQYIKLNDTTSILFSSDYVKKRILDPIMILNTDTRTFHYLKNHGKRNKPQESNNEASFYNVSYLDSLLLISNEHGKNPTVYNLNTLNILFHNQNAYGATWFGKQPHLNLPQAN